MSADAPSDRHRGPGLASVAGVVAAYAVFASLWILLSDRALGLLIDDPATLVRVSMFKGWFFVAVTSVLLYALVRRLVGALAVAHEREREFEAERRQPTPMLVAIADASTDAIYAKDLEGRYLLVNHAAAQVAGRGGEQMIGQDASAIFPPEQARRLMAADRRACETGVAETSEEVLDTGMGVRVFHTTRGPLRDASGATVGSYGIARDITSQKADEAAVRETADDLNATLQAIPDLMFELDAGGCYIKAKALDQALLAAPSETLLGRCVSEVLPPEAAATVMQALQAAAQVGTDFGRTMVLPLASGARHFEISVARKATPEGQAQRFIVLSRDITARMAAESALRQRNEELERFNRAATQRELRMVALKREVNAMARAAGRPEPYDLSFIGPADQEPRR